MTAMAGVVAHAAARFTGRSFCGSVELTGRPEMTGCGFLLAWIIFLQGGHNGKRSTVIAQLFRIFAHHSFNIQA
jgi:hypothetical protein